MPRRIAPTFAGLETVSRFRWAFWLLSTGAVVVCGFSFTFGIGFLIDPIGWFILTAGYALLLGRVPWAAVRVFVSLLTGILTAGVIWGLIPRSFWQVSSPFARFAPYFLFPFLFLVHLWLLWDTFSLQAAAKRMTGVFHGAHSSWRGRATTVSMLFVAALGTAAIWELIPCPGAVQICAMIVSPLLGAAATLRGTTNLSKALEIFDHLDWSLRRTGAERKE